MNLFIAFILSMIPAFACAQPGPGDLEPAEPPCAQIVMIGPTIERPNCQSEGDFIDAFYCTHQFSRTEKEKFIITRVEGLSPQQVKEQLYKGVSDLNSDKINKFPVSLKTLTAADKTVLASELSTPAAKLSILSNKTTDNSKAAVVVGP